ncbi:MarR family winged helix-turn-helix transcriptional regulator [Amycolatopsis sp. lyj-84]|uniref:MarR family winged helix-turn-helix transcriptional regulator n=1 Tax=Amycolatopsis sp. lyj-84 TaxID=2789284 RepID=UPI00397BF3F5
MDDTDSPELDLMAVLPRLTQLSTVLNRSRLGERAMESAGITLDRPAMTVLVTLHMADRPLRVGEIADRMHVVGPHVTRHLNGLERRGLVVRVADPEDQRARLIELTPDGKVIPDRYLRTLLGWFGDALTDWPEEDRKIFGSLLGRFVDDLTARLEVVDDE